MSGQSLTSYNTILIKTLPDWMAASMDTRAEWLYHAVLEGKRWPWASCDLIWDGLFACHPSVDSTTDAWVDVSLVNPAHGYLVREYMNGVGADRMTIRKYCHELRDLDREGLDFVEADPGFELDRLTGTIEAIMRRMKADLSLGDDSFELTRLRALGCDLAIIDENIIRLPGRRDVVFRHFWKSSWGKTRTSSPWSMMDSLSLLGDGEWVRVGSHETTRLSRTGQEDAREAAVDYVEHDSKASERDEIAAVINDVFGSSFVLPEFEESESERLASFDPTIRNARNDEHETEAPDDDIVDNGQE